MTLPLGSSLVIMQDSLGRLLTSGDRLWISGTSNLMLGAKFETHSWGEGRGATARGVGGAGGAGGLELKRHCWPQRSCPFVSEWKPVKPGSSCESNADEVPEASDRG